MKVVILGDRNIVTDNEQCVVCRRIVRAGDVVFSHSVRVPTNMTAVTRNTWGDAEQFSRFGKTIVRWVVIHKNPCMATLMDAAPEDKFEVIQARLMEGGGLFDE